MRCKLLYCWNTTAGTFYIGQSEDGRFHPIYNDESYGSYLKDWQASEDLAHNLTEPIHHPTTGKRIDTSKLGIPDHTSDWDRIRPMEGNR
ncbi:MAG: hypothetical protein ACK5ZC_19220 [Pirellulaceae bacterium]|jgi:hypothetical protein